jgi:hypothetical protein
MISGHPDLDFEGIGVSVPGMSCTTPETGAGTSCSVRY